MVTNRKPKENSKTLTGIFARYLILLILVLFISFSSAFYSLFLKLTIFPANFLLNFFYGSVVHGNSILVNSLTIEIIPACVAVSAYLLLLMLNLSVKMNASKRLFSLLFSFFLLLIINILRIFVLSLLRINDFIYFDAVHKFIWYFLSIVIIAGIWFLSVFLFKIKGIPIWDDFRYIIKSQTLGNKRTK